MPSLSLLKVGLDGEGSHAMVTAYDEAAQVNPAFKVLKTMVMGWLHQVTVRFHVSLEYSAWDVKQI